MPDNTITTEELFSLGKENQTTTAKSSNTITTEELFSLGKSTDPASGTDSGSDDGSSVLLDRIEAGDFGEEPKDEVEQLKQIPGYYDQERITPDPNVGYFPTDIGMSSDFLIQSQGVDQRFKDQALMQPTDQITNQIAEFYTTQENQFQKDKARLLQIDNPEAKANQQKNNPEGLPQAELNSKLLGDLVFFAEPDMLGGNAPDVPDDMYSISQGDDFWNKSEKLLDSREAHMLAETKKAKGFVFSRNGNDPLKVDKEISNYSPSLLSEEDQEIQALIRKGDQPGADALAEKLKYVKLYNVDGSFKDYMPAEQASKAVDLATTNLDDLKAKQREVYSRLIAAQKLANRNVTGGFGDNKYGVGITDHMSGIMGGDLQANYIQSRAAAAANTNSKANQLIETVRPIPGSSPIAEEHNRVLNELKTITHAIELNVNPELLPETGSIIGFQEIFQNRDLTIVSNDERADIFKSVTEEMGLIPKSELKREGDFYGRSVLEGSRDFVDDFAELAASLYITKRLPIGVVKKGKDILTMEAGMTTGVNNLNKLIKASTKSRTVQRFSEVGLGAVKEIVTLGAADVVGDHIFGSEGFVYNKKNKEVHLAFPAALGAGNVISKKIMDKVLRTESSFTRTLGRLNKGVENGTLSAIGTATFGAASGTAVLTFGELIAEGLSSEQQYREMEDGNFETIDEWKEIVGGRKLLETFIGMYMLGGKGTITNMYKGMKADIARIVKKSTVRGGEAAKRMGIPVNSTNDSIKTATNTKIKEINESNLSPEQKLERIKEVKADAESLYWHNDAMTAQKLAKKDNAYVEARENTFALVNKIKQQKELTPQEIERFQGLKDYEHSLMKAKLGASENSTLGMILDNEREIYKGVIRNVDKSRVFEAGGSQERNESIMLWKKVSDIGGEIRVLQNESKNSIVLEGVNKKKITDLREKQKGLIEQLEQKGVEYDARLKEMMKSEAEFAELMAAELGADFKMQTEAEYEAAGGKKGSEGRFVREKGKRDIIYINETAALEARQLGTPLHEVTHAILKNSLKETIKYKTTKEGKIVKEGSKEYKAIKSEGKEKEVVSEQGMVIIDQFLNKLNKKERAAVEKRMEESYKYEQYENGEFVLLNGKKIKKPENEYYEEHITAFSDVLKNKEVKQTPDLARRIGDVFVPILRRAGFKNLRAVGTKSGEGIYNMIKSLQVSSEKRTIDKDVLDAVRETKTTTKNNIAESRTVTEAMKKASAEIDKIYEKESMGGYNEIIERIKGNKTVVDPYTGEKTIEKSKDFIDFYTKIYEGHANYSERRRDLYDAMAYDPTYGVLGSIMKYDASKGTTMAEHILGRLKKGKHIDVANKILGKGAERQFFKSLDATEVKEVKSRELSAEELLDIKLAEEAAAKLDQAPNLRKSLKKGEEVGINQELIDKVENAVVKTFGTKLPLPGTKTDTKTKTVGFKKALNDSYKTELKKPLADWLGTGPKYEVTLRENFEAIMKFVDKSYFVAAESQLPRNERVFTEVEIESMSTKQTDKAIADGRVPKSTSRTAGNTLWKFKKPAPAEFIKFFTPPKTKISPKKIKAWDKLSLAEKEKYVKKVKAPTLQEAREKYITVGSGLRGTRKDRLAEILGIELAKDMTSQVLSRPDVIARIKQISQIKLEGSPDVVEKTPTPEIREARKERFNNYVERVAAEIGKDPNAMFSVTQFEKDVIKLSELIENSRSIEDVIDFKTGKPLKGEYHPDAVKAAIYGWNEGWVRTAVSEIGGNKGYAYETVVQNVMKKLNIKGLEVKLEAGEKKIELEPVGNFGGGKFQAPDFMPLVHGKQMSWELKFGDAVAGKNNAGFINYTKGTFERSSKRNIPEHEVAVRKSLQEAINQAKEVEAILRDKGVLKKGEDFTSKTKIPLEIHNLISGRGGAKAKIKSESVKVKEDFVADYYNSKGVFYMQMHGKGAMFLGSDPFSIAKDLGMAKFEGEFVLKSRIFSSSYKGKDGKTAGYTYKVIAEPKVSPKTITSKSNFNLDVPGAWKKIMATESMQGLGRMARAEATALKANNKIAKKTGVVSESRTNKKAIAKMKIVDKALELGRKINKKSRGMSAFDFDETLIDKGQNFIVAREPNTGKKVKISSSNWPLEGPKFAEQGYTFDFSDFVKVRGGVEGPLFKKFKERLNKFGPNNMFILTARPPEAATAIYGWLKSKGVEIPFQNITGLGNSTGQAKAEWMLKKFSEGYNDMYFVDDAMPNVKAVRNVLNQLDIKSKVQQALSKTNYNRDVNKIMEHSLDIGSEKVFSKAEAKVRGKDIKRRRVFMRDSAADLELLIEPLYGKGKEGIKNKKWFNKEFVMPFERGIRDYNTARQSAKNDYMGLRKQNKDVVKEISKPVEGTAFTNDMAMRVYLWNKAGYKIPDLAKTTEAKLVQHIANNPKLQAYAENFARITKQEKGLKEPGQNWWGETMAGEVTNINRGVSRKQYLQEWIDVKNEIFTEANLNKMESKLGTQWRENITDMFDRMETGRTRSLKMDRGSTAMMNYLNGGIGTIMNFNTRSAVLQTISTTNFLNMRENNPIAAARAMGNVKQFAKDFKYIMNSDMLKQRRDGLAMNVTEAEIASAAASSKNPVQSIISKVLKAGYLPTKMADSFAISFGGATFYRNRIKMYEKQGMKTKEAEKQAFLDFQVIAERTQQSSRADLLSKQQTSLIGRFILPFANTPMQMNRAGMKDILDISKGRYKNSAEVAEKVGRISYYMGAQVAIFAGLQSALFAMLLNDDDVSDEKVANTKSMMLNTTADSMLRGFGVQGAVLSATKNALQEYFKQSAKPGFTADYSEVAEDLLNISPPIGSKFGMLDRAGDRKKWAKIRKNDEFKFELGNPSLEASLMTIQATTNAPVYSPYQNLFNMQHALSDQYETWQRVLMGAGWTPYSVGIETEKKKKKKKRPKTGAEIIEARRRKFLKSRR